jgi:Tol biopolymer transport system component
LTPALTERDILRFRTISDPQVSPDGSSEPRRLTVGPRDSRPRWSPDGSRLAFLGAGEREWAGQHLEMAAR